MDFGFYILEASEFSLSRIFKILHPNISVSDTPGAVHFKFPDVTLISSKKGSVHQKYEEESPGKGEIFFVFLHAEAILPFNL